MSGECEKCGEPCLEQHCYLSYDIRSLWWHHPNDRLPEIRRVDVRGREEHEAIIKSPQKCEELGLDIYYERFIYLKRWGGWLDTTENDIACNP